MPTRCPSCSHPVLEGQGYCSHCGAALSPDALSGSMALTATSVGQTQVPRRDNARFDAGTVITERYRIVGLLGRGGMGEVYRADDLKLDRPVALKFLPGKVEHDPGRLNRLLNEVRAALSVSHANVCRVHDVHEQAGQHFISMEFVDGDDLSALLRRIGRLPQDKALEIARQLCAGLGAAHAAGILHRDLKPANIMIDGRGQVKITDFGLAGLIGGFEGDELRAGTPAYMSPEQLAGEEIDASSDLFSLGLVLYEIYTGKRAFEAETLAELKQARTSAPTNPSNLLSEIDPAIERVIMRCLEHDRADRPTSALAVAAALPGGDPLAAALAAGETPAPELVAEAGSVGGLVPWKAWSLLAFVAVMYVVEIWIGSTFVPLNGELLPKAPTVLEDKAREIIAELGYQQPAHDSIYAYDFNMDYVRHLETLPATHENWSALRTAQPSVVLFGYRQTPGWLKYQNSGAVFDWIDRFVSSEPGAVRIRLDPSGRMVWFDAAHAEFSDALHPRDMDWTVALRAAGMEETFLEPTEARWLPSRSYDERRAWNTTYPDSPNTAIRIEAASLAGRLVAFRIFEPWANSLEAGDTPLPSTGPGSSSIFAAYTAPLLMVTLFSSIAFFAWRNVRLGRGDRRTALRFALIFAGLRFAWYLLAHHVGPTEEVNLLLAHLAWTGYRFCLAYGFYLAFEPYVRKFWPRMLTSWVRLLDGRLRDPLVGRDLLYGLAIGVTLALCYPTALHARALLSYGLIDIDVSNVAVSPMPGVRSAILGLLVAWTDAIFEFLLMATMFLLFRQLLRRDVLTMFPMIALGFVFNLDSAPLENVLISVTFGFLFWYALFRIGLLALFVAQMTNKTLQVVPQTLELSEWWASSTWIVSITLLAIALWAFRSSLAGRPVFRDTISD